MKNRKEKLRIIPLGGMQEIGKNITAFEYDNEIIIVDCGLTFPDESMPGIDLVIPDMSYLIKNKDKIKGVVLTHGHEDHIGGLPYFLKEINVPIYATRLTLGLLEYKLKEHGILSVSKLNVVVQGQKIQLGLFEVEFIRSNHSIPDAVALAIYTPFGVIVHTGDFKVDYTPIEGEMIDLNKFAELGSKGVLALMCESTNVERPGFTMSERRVGETFKNIFSQTKNRILVATFASNVHRIQQVINAAYANNRKVAVVGRSMLNVVTVAGELGYLSVPPNTIIEIDHIGRYRNDQIVILSTGSQGEPMSALARMAASDHKKVEITPGDLVVISATPIPGNEKFVSKVINELTKKGAEVIYEALAETHVSGHACQEEIKLIHSLVKPKYFIPVHGEYRHLQQHCQLAQNLGMPKENMFIMDNGKVLEIDQSGAKMAGSVTAGKVLVDGLGVGDVGNIVLRDRKHLAQDGLIVVVVTIDGDSGAVVAGPDIISRGFVYVRESEVLMEEAKTVIKNTLIKCEQKHITDWSTIKGSIRDSLRDFLYERIKRNPMILPIIMEV
ncbi:MAG TPA: ribonuclease J [Lachnospiraceae bacterium]|nr:ribonuclease J [Lachnospiraceae bacterium]